MSKHRFWVYAALTALICTEALSFAVLTYMQSRSVHVLLDINDYFAELNQEMYDGFLDRWHDQELGWLNRPNSRIVQTNCLNEEIEYNYDKSGARRGENSLASESVSAYGDSFTHGDEVGNQDTWPYQLSRLLGWRVRNFGVQGYGPGQALLRFERNTQMGIVSPFTIFAIHEVDVDRISNRYRPFYYSKTGIKFGFKPSFMIAGNRVEFLSNPNHDPRTNVEQLKELAGRTAATDYFATKASKVTFPFTLQGSKLFIKLVNVLWRQTFNPGAGYWADEELRTVSNYLIDRFIIGARRAGSEPVVLFIPSLRRWSQGRVRPGYHSFVLALKQRLPDLRTIDLADAEFDSEKFNLKPYTCHASRYGNLVIARHVIQSMNWE